MLPRLRIRVTIIAAILAAVIKRQALATPATWSFRKLRIQGSHLTLLAYEAWLGTGPSAMKFCSVLVAFGFRERSATSAELLAAKKATMIYC